MSPGIGVGISPSFQHDSGGGVPTNHLIAARATYLFSGQDAAFALAHKIAAASGSFAYTGQAATPAIRNRILVAGSAAFAMTGQATTMTIGPAPGHFELNAQFGTFNYSGDTMTPVIDYAVPADSGSFTFSGQSSVLKVGRKLPADAASFAVTGSAATLTKTVSYTGPGDVISGAVGWWGLRAYTAASIGSNCVELRRGGDNVTQVFATIAGGGLDMAAITAFSTAGSGNGQLFVKTLYDQTGNGHNFVQNTTGSQPIFTPSGIGSLPIMSSPSANKSMSVTLGANVSQPYTCSIVARRTANFTTEGFIGGTITGATSLWGYANSANNARMNAGSNKNATASDSAFHGIQFVFNGASSDLNVDGTQSTGNAGTNSLNATFGLLVGAGQSFVAADECEFGLWNSAFNSTQSTNMKNNQQAYWGY